MKPSDALGVLIRAAGLGFLVIGVIDLGHIAVEMLGLPTSSSYPRSQIATSMVFWLIIGLALIAGARFITRLIYGRDDDSN